MRAAAMAAVLPDFADESYSQASIVVDSDQEASCEAVCDHDEVHSGKQVGSYEQVGGVGNEEVGNEEVGNEEVGPVRTRCTDRRSLRVPRHWRPRHRRRLGNRPGYCAGSCRGRPTGCHLGHQRRGGRGDGVALPHGRGGRRVDGDRCRRLRRHRRGRAQVGAGARDHRWVRPRRRCGRPDVRGLHRRPAVGFGTRREPACRSDDRPLAHRAVPGGRARVGHGVHLVHRGTVRELDAHGLLARPRAGCSESCVRSGTGWPPTGCE